MRCSRRASAAAEIGFDGKRDREDEPELRVEPRVESPDETPQDESVDAGGEGFTLGTSAAPCAAATALLSRPDLEVPFRVSTATPVST